MSIAIMSAPSSASRTAWLRPCPRAAPVIRATLPSTRFMPGRSRSGLDSSKGGERILQPLSAAHDLSVDDRTILDIRVIDLRVTGKERLLTHHLKRSSEADVNGRTD